MPQTAEREGPGAARRPASKPPAPPRPGEDEGLSPHHERVRRRGVNAFVYWIFRAFAEPGIRVWLRLARTGCEHIPDGKVILASNHRSFLDPFVIGACLRRPIYFVAKKELFDKPWQGWFLNCLGAYPVKRGQSDEETVATSLALLERGEAVVIFPEGTRHRSGPVHEPRRGVGRLALESGAPVVPVAVRGTDRVRRGWIIRPAKVRVRFGPPLKFPHASRPSQRLATEVTARIWPCVELQWAWLGGPVESRPERHADRG